MKTIGWVALIVVAVLVGGYLIDRVFQADAALAQAKLEYATLKAQAEADQADALKRITELNAAVVVQDTVIVNLKAAVAVKTLELTEARKAYAALVDSEPVQPELETEPLVINLRAQVTELRGMVDLGLEVAQAQAAEIETLELKANSLNLLAAEWKASYEREHALRLASEDIVSKVEGRRKRDKLYAYAGAGLALVTGYFIGK